MMARRQRAEKSVLLAAKERDVLEVEEGSARAVFDDGETVSAVGSWEGPPSETIAAWLAATRRRRSERRVVWTGAADVRRVLGAAKSLQGEMLALWLAEQARTYAPRGQVPVACGIRLAGADDEAVLVLVDAEIARSLWRALDGHQAEIVPAGIVPQPDGYLLHVGYGTVTLEWVEGNYPRGWRTLHHFEGLGSLAAKFGVSVDQLVAGIDAGPATEALRGWVHGLASQTVELVDGWASGVLPATAERQIALSGPGAKMQALRAAFADVRFRLRDPTLALPYTGSDRSVVSIALAACRATFPVETHIPDPDLAARLSKETRARRRRVLTTGGVAFCAGAVLAVAVPVLAGDRALASARAYRAREQKQLATLAPEAAIADELAVEHVRVVAIQETDPSWAPLVAEIVHSAPSGTKFGSVSIQEETANGSSTLVVDVEALVPGGAFSPVAQWTANLAGIGAQNVVPTSFAASAGKDTVTITMNFPVHPPRAPK